MEHEQPDAIGPGRAVLQPPPSVIEPKERKLRFRVEDERGNSSLTWSVVANRNTDDVYVGVRSNMGNMKLTLHRDTWRLALTEQAAAERLPRGVDRVITRWRPTAAVAPGWRRAVSVLIPTSSLYAVPDGARTGRTSIFPAPAPGWGLRFDVLLGDPVREGLTYEGVIGEVGRLILRSGLAVWVVAGECQVDQGYESGLQDVRDAAARGAGGLTAPRGWAWGYDDRDGGPVLFDLGGVVGPPPQRAAGAEMTPGA